jgi:hypothetical protein
MCYITAKEARDRMLNGTENDRLENFFYAINDAIEDYKCKFNYIINQENDFTDTELDYIRGLGYEIYWNSACLWYEVSF